MTSLKFQPKFAVVIRYILAEITTEVLCNDALIALKTALRTGLKNHGFEDEATNDYVLALLMEEQPERRWFEVRRIA